jgi:hypothetical protein
MPLAAREQYLRRMNSHPEFRQPVVAQEQRRLSAAGERRRLLEQSRHDRAATGSKRGPVAADVITIRRGTADDGRALRRLAALDSARPLEGELLVAELEGVLWAACSLADGRAVGDPFRPTSEVRALLELRRSQIAPGPQAEELARPGRRWLRQLRLGF